METTNAKWWLDSQTVQGTLMAMVPTIASILKIFGVEVFEGELHALVSAIVSILGVYGAIMAIEGRLKAKQAITLAKPPTE